MAEKGKGKSSYPSREASMRSLVLFYSTSEPRKPESFYRSHASSRSFSASIICTWGWKPRLTQPHPSYKEHHLHGLPPLLAIQKRSATGKKKGLASSSLAAAARNHPSRQGNRWQSRGMEARGGRCTWMRVALVVSLVLVATAGRSRAQLQVGYYDTLCPAAEIIVQEEVSKAVSGNPGVAGSLLRLHFHDCFVRGCDASVLLDSTPGNQAEKDAAPNTSLRGFEVIDNAKTRLEQACFGVVSCADVLAFAARDALALVGGNAYQVPAGRLDGNVSSAQEITSGNLPPPSANVNQLNQIFGSKGLTQADMVTLSGAHTIGMSHCSSFSGRLYSYGPSAGQDPSMDPTYLAALTQQCPQQQLGSQMVPMDPVTPNSFDTNYYANLVAGRGLLSSDQALATDPATAPQVVAYTNSPGTFQSDFAAAMVKMGAIGVLTGGAGTIRTNCRVAN